MTCHCIVECGRHGIPARRRALTGQMRDFTWEVARDRDRKARQFIRGMCRNCIARARGFAVPLPIKAPGRCCSKPAGSGRLTS
jgi:hypothetical protein